MIFHTLATTCCSLITKCLNKMDLSKKIGNVSKEINYLRQMEINNTIKELLLQELRAKKDAQNKKMNYSLPKKKKTQ